MSQEGFQTLGKQYVHVASNLLWFPIQNKQPESGQSGNFPPTEKNTLCNQKVHLKRACGIIHSAGLCCSQGNGSVN